jgi:hypothetical protein
MKVLRPGKHKAWLFSLLREVFEPSRNPYTLAFEMHHIIPPADPGYANLCIFFQAS